ncbi:MAG: hypothetical protein HY078_12315 [Elusimicrobia bacterium]|nr:hypothetical protein [Elusimicrobiota bacterium]
MSPRTRLVLAAAALALAVPALAAPKRKARAPQPVAPFPEFGANTVVSVSSGALTAQGKPIATGSFAPYDKPIRLTSGGRAIVKLGNVGGLLLYGPAEFRLTRGQRPGVRVHRGAALVLLSDPKTPVPVSTRNVNIAAPVGAFFVEARGSAESYVCACDGVLSITNRQSDADKTKLGGVRHRAVVFKQGPKSLMRAEAPQERHDDQDLTDLRAALGAPK